MVHKSYQTKSRYLTVEDVITKEHCMMDFATEEGDYDKVVELVKTSTDEIEAVMDIAWKGIQIDFSAIKDPETITHFVQLKENSAKIVDFLESLGYKRPTYTMNIKVKIYI